MCNDLAQKGALGLLIGQKRINANSLSKLAFDTAEGSPLAIASALGRERRRRPSTPTLSHRVFETQICSDMSAENQQSTVSIRRTSLHNGHRPQQPVRKVVQDFPHQLAAEDLEM